MAAQQAQNTGAKLALAVFQKKKKKKKHETRNWNQINFGRAIMVILALVAIFQLGSLGD